MAWRGLCPVSGAPHLESADVRVGGSAARGSLTYGSARYIAKVTGPDAMEAMTRRFGFLLVCIGVQLVGSGVRSFIAGS